jgi:ATP-dependent Clp protease ATP-binding subunit ClpC
VKDKISEVFERYTESARRALFFARYESSRLGATSIGTEHLLLGVMRAPKGLVSRILAPLPSEKIRKDIESRSQFHEKIPTSVELPFTVESKRVLNVAREEADRLLHYHIGPEHLLLALLREEQSVAATLATYGLRLTDVRLQIVQLLDEERSSSASTGAQASEQIEQIKSLVQQLGRTPPDTREARDLVQRIDDALDAL